MCSTPDCLGKVSGSAKLLARFVLAGAAGCSAWGCSSAQPAPRPELSNAPLTIDMAMQKRDWDRSVAIYPSGAVPAWDTRFHYQPNPNTPAALKPVTEPLAFIGQTLFLPITLITTRPFTPVIARGVQEPASSTAFPAPPDLTLSQQNQQQSSDAGGVNGGASGGGAAGH